MEKRPRIMLDVDYSDRLLEIAAWAGVMALWALALYNFPHLPAQIPSHFNAGGEPDDYSGRGTIFFLPAVGTVLFAGITVLLRYPHLFNYPVEITESNAASQYANAVRLMRYLRLALVGIFLYIEHRTVSVAEGSSSSLGILFLPVMMLVIFVPLIISIKKALKSK